MKSYFIEYNVKVTNQTFTPRWLSHTFAINGDGIAAFIGPLEVYFRAHFNEEIDFNSDG